MDEIQTTQENNTVGRDLAGRDINNNTVNLYASDGSQPTQMGRLVEKFKQERQNDARFNETLEILKHFSRPLAGETVAGLEAKLQAAGREGLLLFAQQTKELFTKKLVEHQFSEAAQEIHAYLLAEVFTRFNMEVVPAIQNGMPAAGVNALVQNRVIDPVQALLDENVLRLFSTEITGMLYYLTGNCHIKWTP